MGIVIGARYARSIICARYRSRRGRRTNKAFHVPKPARHKPSLRALHCGGFIAVARTFAAQEPFLAPAARKRHLLRKALCHRSSPSQWSALRYLFQTKHCRVPAIMRSLRSRQLYLLASLAFRGF